MNRVIKLILTQQKRETWVQMEKCCIFLFSNENKCKLFSFFFLQGRSDSPLVQSVILYKVLFKDGMGWGWLVSMQILVDISATQYIEYKETNLSMGPSKWLQPTHTVKNLTSCFLQQCSKNPLSTSCKAPNSSRKPSLSSWWTFTHFSN